MIDALTQSQSVLTRVQPLATSQSARPQTAEATTFNIDHAIPKDSVEISSTLSQNPVSASSESNKTDDGQLSEGQQEQVSQLKERDAEVRAHEQAHVAAGGSFAGAASYTETRGPDGHSYATAGEVPIDSAPISGDPEASIAKLQTVIAAALAPAQPSAQDQSVAAQAQQNLAIAYGELREQQNGTSEDGEKSSGLQSLLQVQEYPETASDPAALLLNAVQAYQGAGA